MRVYPEPGRTERSSTPLNSLLRSVYFEDGRFHLKDNGLDMFKLTEVPLYGKESELLGYRKDIIPNVKMILTTLNRLELTKLKVLSPRLYHLKTDHIYSNQEINTTDDIRKMITVAPYDIMIERVFQEKDTIQIEVSLPAFYFIYASFDYEMGDMIQVYRSLDQQEKLAKVTLVLTIPEGSKMLYLGAWLPGYGPNRPFVFTLETQTLYNPQGTNLSQKHVIHSWKESISCEPYGFIRPNINPTWKPEKRLSFSGLAIRQTSVIMLPKEISKIKKYTYCLHRHLRNIQNTIGIATRDDRIYAVSSQCGTIVYRDGTIFYPLQQTAADLMITNYRGVFRIY